ncbi:MAG: ribokinase [Phycisphaerae bacterium]|nr:ribokinase [Phycisphaerae bacterium]
MRRTRKRKATSRPRPSRPAAGTGPRRHPRDPIERAARPEGPPSAPRPVNSVCVVGSINTDLAVRVPRPPAPGETLLGQDFSVSPGGKGANQAVAAARAGARVSMIGRTGDDAHGVSMRAVLRAEAIDCSGVTATPAAPTGVAFITVAASGENTIVVSPGANATLAPEDIDASAALVRAAAVTLMQLEVPIDAVRAAARRARAAGRCVMLNAAPAVRLPDDLFALIHVLIVNQTEGAALAGRASRDEERVLRRLADRGPSCVVMTLGARGAVARIEGSLLRVPSPRVRVVDSVAAGDAFCGTLAADWPAVRTTDAVRAALRRACAAGALAATRAGAIPSLPRRDEVDRLLAMER